MKVPEPPANPYYGFAGTLFLICFLLLPTSAMVNAVDPLSGISTFGFIFAVLVGMQGLWLDSKYADPTKAPPADPGGYVTV